MIRLTSDKATTDEAVLAAATSVEVRRTNPVTWPGRWSAKVTAWVNEITKIVRRDGAIDELPDPATVRVEVEFDCHR